jgi:hypothetical protein
MTVSSRAPRSWAFGVIGCLFCLQPAASEGQELADFLGGLALERVGTTEGLVAFGVPVDATIAPGGALLIVDMAEHRTVRLNSDGRVEWESGGPGDGPGEYRLPYRVVVLEGGEVVVYDLSRQDFSILAPDGTFLRRERLPFPMQPLSDMLPLPGGNLAIAGRTRWGGNAADHGIHVFSPAFEHLRSFGPRPEIEDPRKATIWGIGSLGSASGGGLWLSLWGPFELLEYSPEGTLRRRVPTLAAERSVEDMIVIDQSGMRIEDSIATRLGHVRELNGRIHVTRSHPGGRSWDAYDGNWSEAEMPPDWMGLIADFGGEFIWLWRTTIQGESVFEAYRQIKEHP